jgi:hypothetical protein
MFQTDGLPGQFFEKPGDGKELKNAAGFRFYWQ